MKSDFNKKDELVIMYNWYMAMLVFSHVSNRMKDGGNIDN